MTTTTPPMHSVPPAGPAPRSSSDLWGRFLDDLKLHGTRWLRCDFTRMGATPAERGALATAPAPIKDPLVQDYVAWRRSMAWLAIGFALIGTVHALLGVFLDGSGGDSGMTGWVDVLNLLVLGSKATLLVALLLSVRGWTNPRKDRPRLRRAWAVALYVPILMLLLPLADLLVADVPVQPGVEQGVEQTQRQVQQVIRDVRGLLLGTMVFWMSLPALLSVFPGTMRAGIIVKTLLPGRSTGPIVALISGPIYGLLLLVVFATVQQIAGNALMLLGALILIAAPFVALRPGRDLVRPLTREEVGPVVARYRSFSRWAAIAGMVLVLLAMFTTKLFGMHMLGYGNVFFKVHNLLLMVVWFFAMLTTFTVVSADGLLEAMARGDALRAAADASAQAKRDTASVADLEAALGAGPDATTASAPR